MSSPQPDPSVSDATISLLETLQPLLITPNETTVRSIIAHFCTGGPPPPPDVLANTLFVFSKLLTQHASNARSFSKHQIVFRQMVIRMRSTNLLTHAHLYAAFDADSLQLIDSSTNHTTEEKRLRTRLNYTQTRFNLFREHTHGYANLISLLAGTLASPARDPSKLVDALVSQMGRHCLDSNRVIELTLAAACDAVHTLYRDLSAPIDVRLPLCFARVLDEFPRAHVAAIFAAIFQTYHPSPDMPLNASGVSESPAGTPTLGGSTAQTSPTIATAVKTPPPLYFLAAVLIREGRVAIADFWHALSPRANVVIIQAFEAHERSLRELAGSLSWPPKPSVLAPKSAVTVSNTDPSLRPRFGTGHSNRDVLALHRTTVAGACPTLNSQKLQLIETLLGVARWRDARSAMLLLEHCGSHPDIAAHGGIGHLLSNLVFSLIGPMLHATLPTLYPDRKHTTAALEKLANTRAGYAEPVTSVDQLLSEECNSPGMAIREMLAVIGPHARCKLPLLFALCRILKGRSERTALEIMRTVVLPAASLVQSNVALSNAIWEVIRDWPHTDRWEMYGNLVNEVPKTCAVADLVSKRTKVEMRYVLNRLSPETLRLHLGAVTKITHGQALPAFSMVLDRVQGYSADIVTVTPIVECMRDCTNLSRDMLLFLIVDRMSDLSRSRLKKDGINLAQWYSTLSLLLGVCLRKLSWTEEHTDAIVEFLFAKLAHEPEALLITALSDIIKVVAEIHVEDNLTEIQVLAQGGGRYLQSVVTGAWGRLQADTSQIGTSFDEHAESEKSGAIRRLQRSFLRTGVHSWIALSIAQLTRSVVFDEELRSMPLKLSAHFIDRARSSLMQLSQFFDSFPMAPPRGQPRLKEDSDEELRKRLWAPLESISLAKQITELRIPTSSAVLLMSPTLDFLKSPGHSLIQGNGIEDLHGSYKNQEYQQGINVKKSDVVNRVSVEEKSREGEKSGDDVDNNAAKKFAILPYQHVISRKTGGKLSPTFIHAFWTLKLSDIALPRDLYVDQIKRIRGIKHVWEKENERFRRHSNESDVAKRCFHELHRIRFVSEKLEAEQTDMVARQKEVLSKIKMLREEMCGENMKVAHLEEDRSESAMAFLEQCVLPRSRVSVPGALFCARFVLLLLEYDIPAIGLAEYFETLLKLLPTLLRSCSELEALSLARLYKEVLHSLEKWRSNKKFFEAEVASSKLGGLRVRGEQGKRRAMKHEEYCQWLFEMHERLTTGMCCVMRCDEYLYSRNTLSVVAGIAEVFPKVSEHAVQIEKIVGSLSSSELEDIRLSSSSVLARLKAGRAKRVPEKIFRLRPLSTRSMAQARGCDSSGQKPVKNRTDGSGLDRRASGSLIKKPNNSLDYTANGKANISNRGRVSSSRTGISQAGGSGPSDQYSRIPNGTGIKSTFKADQKEGVQAPGIKRPRDEVGNEAGFKPPETVQPSKRQRRPSPEHAREGNARVSPGRGKGPEEETPIHGEPVIERDSQQGFAESGLGSSHTSTPLGTGKGVASIEKSGGSRRDARWEAGGHKGRGGVANEGSKDTSKGSLVVRKEKLADGVRASGDGERGGRGGDRDTDGSDDRGRDRGGAREEDRAGGRVGRRSGDRGRDINGDRSVDRDVELGSDRAGPRGVNRSGSRSVERGDRGGDRGSDRGGARGADRSGDGDGDRNDRGSSEITRNNSGGLAKANSQGGTGLRAGVLRTVPVRGSSDSLTRMSPHTRPSPHRRPSPPPPALPTGTRTRSPADRKRDRSDKDTRRRDDEYIPEKRRRSGEPGRTPPVGGGGGGSGSGGGGGNGATGASGGGSYDSRRNIDLDRRYGQGGGPREGAYGGGRTAHGPSKAQGPPSSHGHGGSAKPGNSGSQAASGAGLAPTLVTAPTLQTSLPTGGGKGGATSWMDRREDRGRDVGAGGASGGNGGNGGGTGGGGGGGGGGKVGWQSRGGRDDGHVEEGRYRDSRRDERERDHRHGDREREREREDRRGRHARRDRRRGGR